MSDNLTRYKKLQWKNAVFHIHDLVCDCQKGIKHTLLLLTEDKEEIKITKEENKQIQQCLTITEKDTTEEDLILDGELAALFDNGDDAATTADTR